MGLCFLFACISCSTSIATATIVIILFSQPPNWEGISTSSRVLVGVVANFFGRVVSSGHLDISLYHCLPFVFTNSTISQPSFGTFRIIQNKTIRHYDYTYRRERTRSLRSGVPGLSRRYVSTKIFGMCVCRAHLDYSYNGDNILWLYVRATYLVMSDKILYTNCNILERKAETDSNEPACMNPYNRTNTTRVGSRG